MYHRRTTEAAKGQWRGILMALGVPEQALRNKHGPCPLCGGTDRFRWDNKEGSGSYICNACGAGDGMKLAQEFTGKPFSEVARDIDTLLGNEKFEPDKPQAVISDQDRRNALKAVWIETAPMQEGDLAHRYLQSRGLGQSVYPETLRFGAKVRDGEGGIRPAMVALVGRHGEPKFDTMHRTFLKPDGSGKAEMAAPRKLMAGSVPEGACVMLSEWHCGPLGIAEGIETAIAASELFEMPVWAAINSTLMAKWSPPEGCEEVAIFADNDLKFGGQAAAYQLAYRLSVKGVDVSVHVPETGGHDWADVYQMKVRTSHKLQHSRS